MDLNKHRVKKLVSDKQTIENELKDIQSNCTHTSTSLKQNRSDVRWHCDNCQAMMGYATPAELKKFFKRD